MANKEIWKHRYPEPDPPPLAKVLNLWALQFSTDQIARMLGVREHVIYNMLARVSR